MTQRRIDILEVLGRLKALVPAGFAVGLHMRYCTPTYVFQTYPKEFAEFYSRCGLVVKDPLFRWAMEHEGYVRWSEVPDPHGFFDKAAGFGLRYGFVCAFDDGSRSAGGFSRTDREFTDDEIQHICAVGRPLHHLTLNRDISCPRMKADLRELAVNFTHP